ncbi:MAG: valine--tRNA ligase [Patescibacteria group bacterium]
MLQSPDMDKRYEHSLHESKIYELWEEAQAFDPDAINVHRNHSSDSGINQNNSPLKPLEKQSLRKPFCIIMPPPNANDPLHIGHAMFVALEDILIRYHRMLGDKTLWLPGTDHAGIETQFVFEKKLKKQGQSRFQFDRETLYQMIWDYVQENSDLAINQIKKLGASADWSRYKFTLDKSVVQEVLQTFILLKEKGLIYRENRLVNYCTKCGTAFSNLEVSHQENLTKLYYIKYGPFTLATTRPETKFADTAVAVHPQDKRYQQYVGQEIECDGLLGKFKLKVVADEFVDPEFGTGVVKITPFHDFNDFEAWQRHKDEMPHPKMAIDYSGRLTEIAGPYAGLKAHVARPQIVEALLEKGLLEKVQDNYKNNIGVCYRCQTIIEPLPLPQFYIQVKPLTQPILDSLKRREIRVHGAGHDKILKHWLENLQDWNISRQIVWGIRMPVWYNVVECPEVQVTFIDQTKNKISGKVGDLMGVGHTLEEISSGLQSLTAPIEAPYTISLNQPGDNYLQETDTFDTWFSSSQWPFVTLKTTKPGDFDQFYPTQVMETGYDILPFWVMRMLMMGRFVTNQLPFSDVYLHGLVRDQKGQKMSKSKGNVVNPLEITEKYGADALRMALVIRSSAGLDKSVGDSDFKAARNLTNKLWNAARFTLLMLEAEKSDQKNASNNPTSSEYPGDMEFQEHLDQLVIELTNNLNNYQVGLAAERIYNEFWHWFCDQKIEQAKQREISIPVLVRGLEVFVKLLHPFMPFVTEAIWQVLWNNKLVKEKLLITSYWPR